MQKQNEKEMEIVQFAWSLLGPFGGPSDVFDARERRQTAIEIRSRVPSGDTTLSARLPASLIASWNWDLNFGADCAIRARVGTHARRRATQSASAGRSF